jgi:hypothetical protein
LGTDKTRHVWAAEMAAMALGTVHLNILCMEYVKDGLQPDRQPDM